MSSEEFGYEAPCPSKGKTPEKKLNSMLIVASEVATVLDRVNVTDRKATMVIAAVAKNLGNNLEEVTLSRNTVSRARKNNRQNYALQKEMTLPQMLFFCIGMERCYRAQLECMRIEKTELLFWYLEKIIKCCKGFLISVLVPVHDN